MTRTPADVVLVNLQIADHAGTELIRKFKQKYPKSQIIALSRSRRSEECVDAFLAREPRTCCWPLPQADVQTRAGGLDRPSHGSRAKASAMQAQRLLKSGLPPD